MWMLMAPNPARRVCPLTGAAFPAGESLIPDPDLSARAGAAKAATSTHLNGMCMQIGSYLFDEEGHVLGRMPGAAETAAAAAPPSTPPPPARAGKAAGAEGEEEGATPPRPSSGMLARLMGKRARTVVPVEAAAGEGHAP